MGGDPRLSGRRRDDSGRHRLGECGRIRREPDLGAPYGQEQTFAVPTGVKQFTVSLIGGGGGGGGAYLGSVPTAGSPGASGEKIEATITIPKGKPAVTLITGAGGAGGPGDPVQNGDTGGAGGAGAGAAAKEDR